jgi:adenine-specific DNA-methyltransferase
MEEVFGKENYIGIFVINSSPSGIDYGPMAKMHDYALYYAKNIINIDTKQLPEKEKIFKYEDEIGPFNLYPLYNGNVAFNPSTRPNLYYPFYLNPKKQTPEGFFEIGLEKKDGFVEVFPVVSKKDQIQRVWRWGKEKAKRDLNKEIVGHCTEAGEYRIVQKTRHTGKVIRSLQLDTEISSRRGTAEVEMLFNTKMFTFPKALELIKRFISVSTEENDIILDSFAGSGTTMHAVMDLNREDGGNRTCIMVQMTEATEREPKKNICKDITRERVKRAVEKYGYKCGFK